MTLSLLAISCEENDLYIDPNYPTTYYKLANEVVSQRRTSLLNEFKYLHSTLNEFGFCYPSENNEGIDPPPNSHYLTKSESIEMAKDFISKRPSETGVENLDNLNISEAYSLSGGIHWVIVSSTQKVDTIEVIYTDIIFRFKNGEIINCEGNWFPNIYIPDQFNFSAGNAKTHIIGQKVYHLNFSGDEYFQTISKSAIENSTTELKIVPIKSSDKIELRVAWMINIPEVSSKVFVDVMTGKIIKQESELIS
jgi:hypothetical protein